MVEMQGLIKKKRKRNDDYPHRDGSLCILETNFQFVRPLNYHNLHLMFSVSWCPSKGPLIAQESLFGYQRLSGKGPFTIGLKWKMQ